MSNYADIIKRLPHRPPFLMIDKIIEVVDGKYVTALKNVSINEPYFQGHFPTNPMMPGVLILEALAQTCAFYEDSERGIFDISNPMLLGVDKAKFLKVVVPGDALHLRVSLIFYKLGIWRFMGEAFVGRELVASAILMGKDGHG
jgi:3-hydroxyacyl-[acyl-carrier-protein] dehydratase